MVDATPKPTVSTMLIHMLTKYLSRQGIDFVTICESAGIPSSVLGKREERVAAEKFFIAWEKARLETEDENFGLHFGKELSENYPGGNFLMHMMANCSTIGNAIQVFCQYHNLMEDAIQPKLSVKKDVAHLSWELMFPGVMIPRHNAETVLCITTFILRRISENRVNPIAVRFGHPSPEDISEHQDIFKSTLQFDQPANELILDREMLNTEIFLASPELLETIEKYAQTRLKKLALPDTWSDRVTKSLSQLLSRGEKPDLETVAKNVAMSTRNLQNKLKEENTTFKQLLDHLRMEVALNYLKDQEITICDIAFLLGFSEQSAFNHAFKRWTGSTPRDFRGK
jgi:AraC-like DNA-binding protein